MRINEVKWVQVRANKVQKMCDTEANVTIFTHPCSPTELKPFFSLRRYHRFGPTSFTPGWRRAAAATKIWKGRSHRFGRETYRSLTPKFRKIHLICNRIFAYYTFWTMPSDVLHWDAISTAGAWVPLVRTQRQAVQVNICQFELSILLRGII